MAEVHIDADAVVIRLSFWERLGAFRGDVRIARSSITGARVVADPWTELRGMRAPGTGWPSVIALGVRRGQFGRDFAAVYRHRSGVVIECSNAEFRRLILTINDPEPVAAALTVGTRPERDWV